MADLASTRVFGKLTVMHDAIVKANAEITGSVTAASFSGDGSALTALDAAALTGTVPDARLPTTATRWPAWGEVTSKPNFAAVATSGSYSDLSGVPSNATDSTDGLMASADKSKLNGIESGATADQTKSDIDALGVDADTVGGKKIAVAATAPSSPDTNDIWLDIS